MSCDKDLAIASGLLPIPDQGSTGSSTAYATINALKHKQNIEFFTMLAQLTMLPEQSKEGFAERVRPNPNKAKLDREPKARKPFSKAVNASIARRKKKSS
jgi:hypothetical protein